MKIREGFVLRNIPGMNVVMPAGQNKKTFHKAVVLNDTASFIFEQLQKNGSEEAAAAALMEEYDIDQAKAQAAVSRTVNDLRESGLIEEDQD